MSKYHHDAYYANLDLDWFCRINNVNIHVASMGRNIPAIFSDRILASIYEEVSTIEMAAWNGGVGFWYNEVLLRRRLQLDSIYSIGRYLSSFVVMARKGFFSFAPISVDTTDTKYYLMAKPIQNADRVINSIPVMDIPELDVQGIDADTPVFLVDLINQYV